MKSPSLTLGIEEEYQIIDPETRELRSYITEILSGDHMQLEEVKPELHQYMVEIGTRVWATRAEARQAVFAYINYYNHKRLHSTINHRTPYEARVCYRQPIALAA
jgi:gamma-glutamyl:cysteine ligase YbdK (ATP-grasp superfamily)